MPAAARVSTTSTASRYGACANGTYISAGRGRILLSPATSPTTATTVSGAPPERANLRRRPTTSVRPQHRRAIVSLTTATPGAAGDSHPVKSVPVAGVMDRAAKYSPVTAATLAWQRSAPRGASSASITAPPGSAGCGSRSATATWATPGTSWTAATRRRSASGAGAARSGVATSATNVRSGLPGRLPVSTSMKRPNIAETTSRTTARPTCRTTRRLAAV